MICEFCHGSGWAHLPWMDQTYVIPCPECGGCGTGYCCEGSERFGQLDGESTGRESSADSNTDGTERYSDQDGGSPPLSR